MRLQSKRAGSAPQAAVTLLACLVFAPSAFPVGQSPPTLRPTEAEVSAAVRALREDPNLVSTRKMHVLHWVGKSEARPTGELPGWLQWISDLFAWLAEGGRMLVWIACLVVVGVLAIFLLRLLSNRGRRRPAATVIGPTHVRDLDIRPESLPDDIGAAARRSWDQGERRAALALLYRGSLSRLTHVHGVPIRHSTTEGECVQLANQHLNARGTTYISQLVRVWQRAVYRGEEPLTQVMVGLCDEFEPALEPAEVLNPDGITA